MDHKAHVLRSAAGVERSGELGDPRASRAWLSHLLVQGAGIWVKASRLAVMWSSAVLDPVLFGGEPATTGSPVHARPGRRVNITAGTGRILPGRRGLLFV